MFRCKKEKYEKTQSIGMYASIGTLRIPVRINYPDRVFVVVAITIVPRSERHSTPILVSKISYRAHA